MFIKKSGNCEEFTASDGCRLRELLHPKNDPVELPYSIAVARVEAGKQTYRHILKQTEIYYILSGTGRMHVNEEIQEVKEGDAILIPPGSIQWLENTGMTELRFIAIVSPPWAAQDDVRVEC